MRQLWKVFEGGFDAGVVESEKWKAASCPEGGNGVGDFFLEDFGDIVSFCLKAESSLYKYMRIYL